MTANFVGRWQRTSDSPCSARYPAQLEFLPSGRYTGRNDGDVVFWDVGSWEDLGDGRVRISTANDAEIPYRYTVSADTLTFADPEGCDFSYRRAG